MSIRQKLMAFGAFIFLERPVQDKSYADLGHQLEQAGQRILARLETKTPTQFNHRVFTHIIGIERWGQSRLRSLIGGPLLRDEYNGYRPARDVPWDDLIGQFRATRSETVAIVQQMADVSVEPETTVLHNQFGPISARAWLRYLETHASREILQVR